jgi:hypothetical protein
MRRWKSHIGASFAPMIFTKAHFIGGALKFAPMVRQ